MVSYQRSHLKVAELFFDEPAGRVAADIVRYHHRSTPVAGGRADQRHTLWIDLTAGPEAILADMNADTRRKIRGAAKDGARYEFQSSSEPVWLEEFCLFYDRFARTKGLPPANRARLGAMVRQGALDLSRMVGRDGEVLVWHAHLLGGDRARLLHSASIFREMDKDTANAIGRVNRLHHWMDIERFRNAGFTVYDFGGWYAGHDDVAKLRINDFKRGFGGEIATQYHADCAGSWKGAAVLGLRALFRTLRGKQD